ncbi:unnamed protein product [Adineta ricciae]|uniref:Uncharacterized protein n=1 Tax=Adineta ricciae TaxID=249248 RepID=A0A815L3T5_ADIRI|nr:unnamed protein product [Adineta ricciae]
MLYHLGKRAKHVVAIRDHDTLVGQMASFFIRSRRDTVRLECFLVQQSTTKFHRSQDCLRSEVIMDELMHTLGKYLSRTDHDTYVHFISKLLSEEFRSTL